MESEKIEFKVPPDIRNTQLHVHTMESLHDSATKIKDLFDYCVEMGIPVCALTEHGVLTEIDKAMALAKDYPIKVIPGIEFYYQEDDTVDGREHLIVWAMTEQGYRTGISKATTAANMRMEGGFPRVNTEILKLYFGEGSAAHGQVKASSACMGGVLATILLRKYYLSQKIEKMKKKQDGLEGPHSLSYKNNVEAKNHSEEDVQKLIETRELLSKLAKKPFAKKIKSVDAKKDTNEYVAAKAELDAEIALTKTAEANLVRIKAQIVSVKKNQTLLNNKVKDSEKEHIKWYELEKEMNRLNDSIKPEEELYEEAKVKALEYQEIFGKGNFYVELQYHGIPEEFYVMPKLARLAEELDLPLVATNDVHTLTDSKDDLKARQIMRSLRFNKWEEPRLGDDELYVKTGVELESELAKILPSDVVEKAMQGMIEIAEASNVVFKKDNHYPAFKSEIPGEDAVTRLRRLAVEGIEWRYPGKVGWTTEHAERLEYELETIKTMGFSDYLCIVEDFLKYGRILGRQNPEEVGIGIGPGRGSAVGSLVCYNIGITGIDPMQYGLIFERFLNPERVSMPKRLLGI